jgi:hypothetical protein
VVRRNVIITLSLCVGVGVAVGVGVHHVAPTDPLVRGLMIGDRFAPSTEPASAWLTRRRDAARDRVVRFRHEEKVFEATLGEAGVEIDVAATLERAAAIGHAGTMYRRLREAREARAGKIDVPLVWRVDQARALALMERLAPQVYEAPIDARIDMERHNKVPDVVGKALDEIPLAELESMLAARGEHSKRGGEDRRDGARAGGCVLV